MRLLASLKISNLLIFNILMFLSLSGIVYVFSTGEYYLFLLPLSAGLLLAIIFIPESIPYLLLISNFYGTFILEKSYITITITDIFFLIVVIAYISSKLFIDARKTDRADNSKISTILILFLITSIFSLLTNIPFAEDRYLFIAFWYLFKLSQLLLTFFIFSDCPFTRTQIERLITICLVLSLFQIPVVWYQITNAMGYGAGFSKTHYAVSGTLTYHHSMLGTFILIPLSFSLYRFLISSTLIKKVWYGLIGTLFIGIIVFTGCRSALLGLIISCLLYLVLHVKFQKKYILYVTMFIIASLIIYTVTPLKEIINSTFYSHNTQTLDLSSVSRLFIWKSALNHFFASDILQKLFGVGIGAYSTIQNDFVLWGGLRAASGAHNNFLHVLSEIGIVGFIIFILLFYTILRNLYSTKDQLCRAFFFATIALLASGITQETFWFQRAFGSFWLCYMFFLAIILQRKQRKYQ